MDEDVFPERPISAIEPLTKATNLVSDYLFKPFDIGKWFIVGFTAFLAHLGSAEGGGNCNCQFPGEAIPSDVADWVRDNVDFLIALGVGVGIAGLLFYLVLLWIGCRGKFMLLDNIAHDRAEVRAPWAEFSAEGNSLFVLRLATNLIFAVLTGLAVGGFVLFSWDDFQRSGPPGQGFVIALILTLLLLFILFIAFMVITFAIDHFAIPIMYSRRISAFEALAETRRLAFSDIGNFLIYTLLCIALAIALGIAAGIITLMTCCLAALPYLGTVILLPLDVFWRGYSAYFIQQYGYPIFEGADTDDTAEVFE